MRLIRQFQTVRKLLAHLIARLVIPQRAHSLMVVLVHLIELPQIPMGIDGLDYAFCPSTNWMGMPAIDPAPIVMTTSPSFTCCVMPFTNSLIWPT